MELIQQGIEKGLIRFDKDRKNIFYLHQDKRRNYTNPEEQVQAETFLKLVLEYGYPVTHIQQFVSVKMGVSIKEADIIVYKDAAHTQPYIIVECKSLDISEQEFKQAIEQAFGYAYALAGTTKYIWVTKGNTQRFFQFDKEKNLKIKKPNIPYYGENSVNKYSFAKGGYYFDKIQGTEKRINTSDLQAVTEKELSDVFKQAHDALWAGGELNPSQAFDELDKLIFCKIRDERNTKRGQPYEFQIFNDDDVDEAKNLAELKERVIKIYEEGKSYDPEIFNKPIDLTPERIETIVGYFQSISFLKTDLDSKGKAFETFLGTYFRGDFGQYFTPRNVVKFVIDVLPITYNSRVLDTSCGSGGFLLYCLDKVRKQAELDYDKEEAKEHWHNFASKKLFGIEINDQISRVAKMNMIIHDDGHTNVINFDGLFQIDYIAKNCNGGKGNAGFEIDSFDYIVTNPPFGSIIKQSEKSYMQIDAKTAQSYYDFSLKDINWIDAKIKGKHTAIGRENQSTEILFIEQCHKFLKADAYLAIVIPDGILTNSSSQYVRDNIEEKFRIVGVVSLPQTAFTNTGAGVKSSVLFLKKHPTETTKYIQKTKRELQDDLAFKLQLEKTARTWEKEKAELIKKGDAVCQQIEIDLKQAFEGILKQAHVLTSETQKQMIKEAKDKRKEYEKTDEYAEWKKAINEEYSEKLNAFKEDLEEQYSQQKQARLVNYPIFMAIAENIGYDATGKTIPQNDLPEITEELRRFIDAIETGEDANFL